MAMTYNPETGNLEKLVDQPQRLETCKPEDLVNRLDIQIDAVAAAKAAVNKTIAEMAEITANVDIPIEYEVVPPELTGSYVENLKGTVAVK